MGLIESLQSVAGYLAGGRGPEAEGGGVSPHSAAEESRSGGQVTSPAGLPLGLPVLSTRGFRRPPLTTGCRHGAIGLVYWPRTGYDETVAFHEELLPEYHWSVADVQDDRAPDYRARRFEIHKGGRRGSIAVEETLEERGPLQIRVVVVTVDVPCVP